MLCATCISIFQGPQLAGIHHQSFENLVQAANSSCKICNYLLRLRQIEGADETGESTRPFTNFRFRDRFSDIWIEVTSAASWLAKPEKSNIELHVPEPSSPPKWWAELLELVDQDLATEPWRVRQEQFDTGPCPGNTGDPEVVKLCSDWLNDCIEHHQCEDVDETRQQGYFPDRLLHVGTLESPSTRLMITATHMPTESDRYATLSHCWGKAPFIKLTVENMSSLCNGISPDDLPRSFSDAIVTCRHLRIKYLWIDSLCILQSGSGSKEDWQAHVASMHTIYANCVLNLAAVGASNPEQGIFVDRDPCFIKPTFVFVPERMGLHNGSASLNDHGNSRTREQSTDGGSIDSENGDAKKACLVKVFVENDFFSSVYKQPLWRRGWVFQERLMSPRSLLFGQDRVYWQCEERLSNEYSSAELSGPSEDFDRHYLEPFNIPYIVLRRGSPTASSRRGNTISQTYREWYGLVDDYSERDLTYPTKDRLAAISAIASRFDRVLPGRYCAGLFDCDLPLGLLWEQCYNRDAGRSINSDWDFLVTLDGYRDPELRAPSWSWASVDGRTSFFPAIHAHAGDSAQESYHVLAKFEGISKELEDSDHPFGHMVAGQMTIRGPVFYTGTEQDIPEGSPGLASSLSKSLEQELLGLCIMEEMRTRKGKTSSTTYGTLLSPLENDIYQRHGYFELKGPNDGSRFPIDAFERKAITIA